MTYGALIFAAVLVITMLAVAYGLYTRTGSGINPRPWGTERRDSSADMQPGAQGVGETSGRDEGEHAPVQHGTR